MLIWHSYSPASAMVTPRICSIQSSVRSGELVPRSGECHALFSVVVAATIESLPRFAAKGNVNVSLPCRVLALDENRSSLVYVSEPTVRM